MSTWTAQRSRIPARFRGGPIAEKAWIVVPAVGYQYARHRGRRSAQREAQRLTLLHDAVFLVYGAMETHDLAEDGSLRVAVADYWIVVAEVQNVYKALGTRVAAQVVAETFTRQTGIAHTLFRVGGKYKPARYYGDGSLTLMTEAP